MERVVYTMIQLVYNVQLQKVLKKDLINLSPEFQIK